MDKFNWKHAMSMYRYLIGIVAITFIFFAFYYRLASYELLNINEGLYAEIAREMLVTQNYILPQLNFTLYIEKPPLLYWLVALSFDGLGVNVFAARFISAMSGVATCCALIFLGARLNRIYWGYLAAIIVASSVGLQIIMRTVYFDPLLTACVTIALVSFYIWYERASVFYLRCFYVFLGLAFLTKGFIGIVLPVGIVFFFLLGVRYPYAQWRSLFDAIGILLFFAVVLPWHIAMAMQHENFLWRYLVEEQFLRFLRLREPIDYHTGPFYYYLPRILVYLLPWTCLFPIFFFSGFFRDRLSLFLWLWFLVPLIFFSLSSAKGNYYMVLGVPPLALLLSRYLCRDYSESRRQWWVLGLVLVFLAIYATLGLVYVPQLLPAHKHAAALLPLMPTVKFIMWSLLALGIAGGCIALFYKRKLGIALALLISIFISMIHVFTLVKERLQDNASEVKIGQYVNTHLKGQTIYLYEDFEEFSTVLFYIRERMPIVNSRSADLAYGKVFAPKGWFITDKEFKAIAAEKPVYMVILKHKANQLPPAFYPLVESTSTVLVTNYPKS